MTYQKGLHIIATLKSNNTKILVEYGFLKELIDNNIKKHELKNLGQVYYNFETGGCTGVVCLSESHISFHTWPEYNLINIDIYLSNFKKDNSKTVTEIFQHIVNVTESEIITKSEIYR